MSESEPPPRSDAGSVRAGARRLLTRLLLVAGAVYVGGRLSTALPRDQQFVLRRAERSSAARVRLIWTRVGDREASGGAELWLRAGVAELRQRARLPNGDYLLTIESEATPASEIGAGSRGTTRDETGDKTTVERRVTLRGGETLVRLDSAVTE